MDRLKQREKSKELRKRGKTYSEIKKYLKINIPKSTLSCWCKDINLPSSYKRKIQEYNKLNLIKARRIAQQNNKTRREKYIKLIIERNKSLKEVLKNKKVAKIALAMLYLGEGSKTRKGSLMFGNSDPVIVKLFLHLLRYCYNIDENKFRCTLQCRADQNVKKLEKFWMQATKIPSSQFYKAQIDPRTIGKPSKKQDYKGVCRIDYFSAELFIELRKIVEIIYNEGS